MRDQKIFKAVGSIRGGANDMCPIEQGESTPGVPSLSSPRPGMGNCGHVRGVENQIDYPPPWNL